VLLVATVNINSSLKEVDIAPDLLLICQDAPKKPWSPGGVWGKALQRFSSVFSVHLSVRSQLTIPEGNVFLNQIV
jgi:hypothetical protein